MRTLTVLSEKAIAYLLGSGGLAAFEGPEDYYVVSDRLNDKRCAELIGRRPGYLGVLDGRDAKPHHVAGERAFWARRGQRVFRPRALLKGRLPGVHLGSNRRHVRRIGRNSAALALLRRLQPDVVVTSAYSRPGGYAALDVIAAARELGVPSVFVQTNWDYLIGTWFPVLPDYFAAWGPQSVEEAVKIHGFKRDRVFAVGSSHFQRYFDLAPETTQSPFPFKYALFAGAGGTPLDVRDLIEAIDRTIEQLGLDLKLVYRPHPDVINSKEADMVAERRLRHVVIDPDRRGDYLAEFDQAGNQTLRPEERPYPKLGDLSALLENAEFVVCPLTTVMLEAALFDKHVIVPVYDYLDELIWSLDLQGIYDIEHFAIPRSPDEVAEHFAQAARSPGLPRGALRDHPVIRDWLYSDERTYAQRLTELVEMAADRNGSPASGETVHIRHTLGEAAPAATTRR